MSEFLAGVVPGVCLGMAVMGIWASKQADAELAKLVASREVHKRAHLEECRRHADTDRALAAAQAENDQLHAMARARWLSGMEAA